jgi:hypothetical protein
MPAVTNFFRSDETRARGTTSAPIHDVTDSIKSWARRGIFFGANFGFILGTIFVAIPLTSDVLAFGAIGTLLVGTLECAFIAGAFAAFAAALHAKGVLSGNGTQFEHILPFGRRSAISFTVPLADLPCRWAYPVQASRRSLLQISDDGPSTTFSLLEARARLSTIDAWENGNTGP